MRIFITGGTGFIGLPTVKLLARRGHKLFLLSRHPEKFGLAGVRGKNIQFAKGDLSNMKAWNRKLKMFKPEAALHMAWEGFPDYGPENSIKNLLRDFQLFELLAKIGCKRIVVSGTCAEYGAAHGKLNEDAPLQPLNSFSAAKNASHWIGRELARACGMEFVWTRIFYCYGPGQRRTSLIPHLLLSRRSGTTPKVKNLSGGNDFIYVDDVARALTMILEKRKLKSDLYNIGSGVVTAVRDVFDFVYGGKPFRRAHRGVGFCADISRIKREVGWKPKVGLRDGILRASKFSVS
ncbi:MAG: NAD(P)-dependent oxidoreductase [Candidatus Liptonbacteria bacterium]|nr:NAD(P)-dependent oxidoreductase [Parcubacteria group bacterium]MBI4087349.1 NAD(P)-dependent oxidoreductase [Candidatus Liptonbacteria bacterium]